MSGHAALLEGLGLLLPTVSGRQLLRAILRDGDGQAEALAQVIRSRDLGMRTTIEQGAARTHRPLLHYAVAGSDCPCDPAISSTLRTARVREQGRTGRIIRLAERAMDALTAAGTKVWVLKGLSLACRVYPEPGLRHTHDLDLLVHPDDLSFAVAALESAGFRNQLLDSGRAPAEARLLHPSGFPIELHTTLFPETYYGLPFTEIQRSCQTSTILGRSVGTLSPDAHLLQVLGLAASAPQRHSLRWVVDSVFLIRATPDFCWGRFEELCALTRLALPVSVMLRYLSDELGAGIPRPTLDRLQALARAPSPLERDLALAGARAGFGDSLVLIRNARSGWAARLRTSYWLFFPSRAYLRHTAQTGYGRRALDWLRSEAWRLRLPGTWMNHPKATSA